MNENPGEVLGALLKQALGTAQNLLDKSQALHPFAITHAPGNDGQILFGDPSADSGETLDILYKQLRNLAKSGSIVAFAMVVEVSMTNRDSGRTQDAVHVSMEHLSYPGGDACVVPFSHEGGQVKWGRLARVQATPAVWQHEQMNG